MKAVTIREAKVCLNALVEAAERGEQIVLMRGSKHVAAIVPVSADDLELALKLTDVQAGLLWCQLYEEHRAGRSRTFENPERAAGFLRRMSKGVCKPENPVPGSRPNRSRHQ